MRHVVRHLAARPDRGLHRFQSTLGSHQGEQALLQVAALVGSAQDPAHPVGQERPHPRHRCRPRVPGAYQRGFHIGAGHRQQHLVEALLRPLGVGHPDLDQALGVQRRVLEVRRRVVIAVRARCQPGNLPRGMQDPLAVAPSGAVQPRPHQPADRNRLGAHDAPVDKLPRVAGAAPHVGL